MSEDDNKAVVRRYYEESFNRHDVEVLGRFLTPDVLDHNADPAQAPGLEGVKQLHAMYHAAFPDLHGSIEDLVAEGDKVTTRVTYRGTHRGELLGLAPTGTSVTIAGMEILRLVDGKIAEYWYQLDTLGMLQQLGAIPT